MNYTFPSSSKITRQHYLIIMLLLVILLSLLAGCSQQTVTFTPEPTNQEPIEPTSEPTLALTLTPQLLLPPYYVWVDPALPEPAGELISQQAEFNLSTSQEQALMTFSAERSEQLIGSWTYLVVAPFYSSLDNIQYSDLSSFWKSGSIDNPEFSSLFMSEETKLFLS